MHIINYISYILIQLIYVKNLYNWPWPSLALRPEVGLAKFSLSGNACVLLSPLIDAVPIFAGGA